MKCVLKCIPVIALLFQMSAVLTEYSIESIESHHHEKTSKLRLFLWAVTFSAIGDACLVFPKIFVAGILSFALSLCIYMNMFDVVKSLFDISIGGITSGLCIYIPYVLMVVVMVKQTAKLKPLALPGYILTILVSLYFFILSSFLWSGVLVLQRQGNVFGICSAVGAGMFYISDLMIAANAIWDVRLLQGRALIMITYYTAHLFLALSLTLY